MTQENPTPAPAPIVIDETEQAYEKSAAWLKNALIGLEVMGVMFTLPHNLDAFNISFATFTWSILFGILGVATIEGAWLFSMSHFTHGWIADKRQRNMAIGAWLTMTAVLIGNAIVAELGHIIAAQEATAAPALVNALVAYRGFFLPSTPIIALVLSGLLLSMHPKVIQMGRTFQHLAETSRKEQEAQLALLDAKHEIKRQDISAKRQEHEAELQARTIAAEAKIEKMRADALQSKQNQDFALDARTAVFNEKKAALDSELESDEFKTQIRETVQAEVKRIVRDQKKEALDALKKG